jgi:hypothetical protein
VKQVDSGRLFYFLGGGQADKSLPQIIWETKKEVQMPTAGFLDRLWGAYSKLFLLSLSIGSPVLKDR